MKFFLGIVICILGVLPFTQVQAGQGRTIYVSLVPPNSVLTYFDRFPAEKMEIVFTARSLGAKSQRIVEPAGSSIWIAELSKPLMQMKMKKLAGEIGRFQNFALVLKKDGTHAHENTAGMLWMRLDQAETTHRIYPQVQLPERLFQKLGVRALGPKVSISEVYLQEKLSEFSGAKAVVIKGQSVVIKERGSPEGRELARNYLTQEYQKLGYQTSVHNYQTRFAPGGANFIAQKPGVDPQRFVIVSSHLDSVSNAGADDDGSGTISALAIAQAFAAAKINMGLRIVAFDQEEIGLVGAKAYAKNMDQLGEMKNLMGVFHLEMNGYHKKNDGGFHIIDCSQNTSADLSAFIVGAMKTHNIPLKRVDACTSASDHSVFWRYGKPAIVTSENFFGGDGNSCYHKACNTVANLNFGYMAKVVEANANALAVFLEAR